MQFKHEINVKVQYVRKRLVELGELATDYNDKQAVDELVTQFDRVLTPSKDQYIANIRDDVTKAIGGVHWLAAQFGSTELLADIKSKLETVVDKLYDMEVPLEEEE